MIHVVWLQHDPGKLREQVILFIRRVIGADNANGVAAIAVANLGKALADQLKGLFPSRRRQLAVLADQRLGEAGVVVAKIKSITALDAEEIAVDPALVAIVAANNLHAGVGAAHTEGGLATVATVGADRAHMVHLPGPRLVAVGSRGQRANRTNVNAHPAFFALKMIV